MDSKTIQRLAKKASKFSCTDKNQGRVYEAFTEKFAELVIKEFVTRLKKDTGKWVDGMELADQNEVNKLYEQQLARQLDEEWYWAIK